MMLLVFSFDISRDYSVRHHESFCKWLHSTKFYGGCQVYKKNLGLIYRILAVVDCSTGFLVMCSLLTTKLQWVFYMYFIYLSFQYSRSCTSLRLGNHSSIWACETNTWICGLMYRASVQIGVKYKRLFI